MLTHGQELKSGDICLAEYQSAGRGRRGRQWLSPYGHHIYASLYWRLEQGMPQAMGLSLVVACSIVTVLKQMGVADLGLNGRMIFTLMTRSWPVFSLSLLIVQSRRANW